MPNNITLANLMTRIRNRWDIESQYVSDAVLIDMINQAYAELYDYICNINPEWLIESVTVSVVSGTSSYQVGGVSNDTYKVYGVDVSSGGRIYNMQKFIWAERNTYSNSGQTAINTRYRFVGVSGNIEFRPVPKWSQDVTVWIIPYPPTFATDGSDAAETIDTYAAWEQFIVTVVGIYYFDKRGTDNFARVEYERMNKRLFHSMRVSDKAEPDYMRDIDMESIGGNWGTIINP